MLLEQNRILLGTTQLVMREHGLYACQRTTQNIPLLEVEVPYEKILPVQLERTRQVPTRWLLYMLALIVWVGIEPVQQSWATGTLTPGLIGVLVFLVVLGGFVALEWDRRWFLLHFRTAHLSLTFADRRRDRAQFYTFAHALEKRVKEYLRAHYGRINPLGPSELQVRRLQGLQEMQVLSEPEARALMVRLTGRQQETLQGMGHELEGLYEN
jgi:hypothetical protein